MNDAQDRYKKRYMEKENKKLRREHELKERRRIMNLTDLAYKNDPRIQEELKQIEAEKERLKEEKRAYRAKIAADKEALK